MRRIVLHLIIIAFVSVQVKSQTTNHNVSAGLEKLFTRLEKIYDDDTRIRINDSIRFIIDSYAASDSVFEHQFTGIRHLGQITSSNNKLKIITWNLILQSSANRYFCYFIKKGEHKTKNIIYRLTGLNSGIPVRTDTTYSEENWYGALYYDLRPVKIKKDICYVLLGIDFGNTIVNRKIIEVLSFTRDGGMILGMKWFDTGNEIKFREVFEYDATGVMSLKFLSGKSIVFDHLVPLSPGTKEEQQSFGAEYSFDSYTYKNGLWKFKKNIDVRNKE